MLQQKRSQIIRITKNIKLKIKISKLITCAIIEENNGKKNNEKHYKTPFFSLSSFASS